MPLLPKEPEIHPDELFALPAGMTWIVAHVRSRQEKVLARHLLQHDVPFYLPQVRRARRHEGRTRTSHLPLFPGYVFLRGGRDAAYRSNVVAALLEVEDQQILGEELRQIRDLQLAGASLEPYDAIVAGDAVRVTEGAFAGYVGVVEREKGRDRLLVMVSLLRKAVAVEFERDVLAALHHP
ncbi:MAG: hypothetical protein JOZ54_25725 [Acidobacteria bacterium]|nr:hypothetical protein [Acidobacteriota bacterium]